MNASSFGYAFEWGTPYDTVLEFLNRVSNLTWHDKTSERIYVSLQAANEHYFLRFRDNNLYEISCLLMSSNESNADLPGLMERFISEYNILELEEYTGSDKLNKRAENNPGTLIAADKDTVYCVYTHEVDENEKYIPYAELILQDRSYTEQSSESSATTGVEENAKLNLGPNISPADFNNDVFGYALHAEKITDVCLKAIAEVFE